MREFIYPSSSSGRGSDLGFAHLVCRTGLPAGASRIELRGHWKPWLRLAIEKNGWEVQPISLEIVEEAYSLPGKFHADPADRILTATARCENLLLLTTDRKLLDYPHVTAGW